MQKRVFLKHGSRYDAHFNRTRTGGGCIRFNYIERLWGRGGSYPEFQILQLRIYLWYICTFLVAWCTFYLHLINQ